MEAPTRVHEQAHEFTPEQTALRFEIMNLHGGEQVPKVEIKLASQSLERDVQNMRKDSATELRKKVEQMAPAGIELHSSRKRRESTASSDQEFNEDDVREDVFHAVESLTPSLMTANLRALIDRPLEDDPDVVQAIWLCHEAGKKAPFNIRSYLEAVERAMERDIQTLEKKLPHKLHVAFGLYQNILQHINELRGNAWVGDAEPITDALKELKAEVKNFSELEREELDSITEEYRHMTEGNVHVKKEEPKKMLATLRCKL